MLNNTQFQRLKFQLQQPYGGQSAPEKEQVMFEPVMDEPKAETFTLLDQTPTRSGPSYLIVLFGFLFACMLLVLSAGVILDLFKSSH
jgi:hypothetical protein